MRHFDRVGRLLMMVGLALGIAFPVWAAECDWGGLENAGDARRRLEDFRREGCLLAPACDLPLCRRVAALENPTGAEVSAMLGEIADSLARELPPDYPGVTAMKARLDDWTTKVVNTPLDQLPIGEWQVMGRSLFSGEGDEVRFGQAIAERMSASGTPAGAEFVLAATQMRMALLVHQALLALLASNREKYVARLQSLDRRWQSYLRDSRSTYPWEWLASDYLLGRRRHGSGFQEPPSQQMLLAHPDAAYQYAAFGAERLTESLVVELLGLYRWKWGTDDRLRPRLSGSTFVGWSGNTQETPYWGVMAHFAHAGSLGAGVRSRERKSEWAVFASADAGKLFLKKSDARADVVRDWLLKAGAVPPP